MKTLKTTVLADAFFLLRAARWHAGALWMCDNVGRKVYCLNLDGTAKVVAEVREQPFGIGFLHDGTPLVTSTRNRRLLRLENGRLACHADLRALVTGEINEMIVDHHGRGYALRLPRHQLNVATQFVRARHDLPQIDV